MRGNIDGCSMRAKFCPTCIATNGRATCAAQCVHAHTPACAHTHTPGPFMRSTREAGRMAPKCGDGGRSKIWPRLTSRTVQPALSNVAERDVAVRPDPAVSAPDPDIWLRLIASCTDPRPNPSCVRPDPLRLSGDPLPRGTPIIFCQPGPSLTVPTPERRCVLLVLVVVLVLVRESGYPI